MPMIAAAAPTIVAAAAPTPVLNLHHVAIVIGTFADRRTADRGGGNVRGSNKPDARSNERRKKDCTHSESPLLVLLSQKVAGEARSDSGKGRDSEIGGWRLI